MDRTLKLPQYDIHIGSGALDRLAALLNDRAGGKVLVVADSNTAFHCMPRLEAKTGPLECIAIPPGETHKHLETCKHVWQRLTEMGAGRDALIINLGGGMVGDIGGFTAACFKRGIGFVQVPTSLLAMVDASVGGKTGVNFLGYKNQLGSFQDPEAVFVNPDFLHSLPPRELRSGYAEVLKHCLIADRDRWETLSALPGLPLAWEDIIADSITVKARIVMEDPLEKGIRAALNFGHTIGHAVESASLQQDLAPLVHGEAVAVGMVCEAFIAHKLSLISQLDLESVANCLGRIFPKHELPEDQDEMLTKNINQDKKNQSGKTRFALIDGIGKPKIGVEVPAGLILESFAYYRNLP